MKGVANLEDIYIYIYTPIYIYNELCSGAQRGKPPQKKTTSSGWAFNFWTPTPALTARCRRGSRSRVPGQRAELAARARNAGEASKPQTFSLKNATWKRGVSWRRVLYTFQTFRKACSIVQKKGIRPMNRIPQKKTKTYNWLLAPRIHP